MKLSRLITLEIISKNLLVLLIFFVFIQPRLAFDTETLQEAQQGSVLSMLGFLMAATIIGAFELSYAKTRMSSNLQRYLAHITKFLLYLAISILLWISLWTMEATPGDFNFWLDWIFIAGIIVYISLFLFDFWDASCAVDAQLRER
jgi:uncharacterized membrane protein YgdD (TMEM256/DUF423 family)